MPNQKKLTLVSEISQTLKSAKSIVLIDYRGLTTKQLETLRKKAEEANGNLQIAKNTLLRLAFEKNGLKLPELNELEGPTAIITSSDENSALKAINEAYKTFGSNLLVKMGILDNSPINKSQATLLGTLPTKEELLIKFLVTLQSPIYSLAWGLKSNPAKLVYLLTQKGGAI